MCKNCTQYAREMINKRYNKVLKALSDEGGDLNIDRAEKFERVFSDELGKRALVMVNNFVRTDQELLLHLRRRIVKEKKAIRSPKININIKSSVSKEETENDEKTNVDHHGKDEFETISTVPDSGVCRRLWNPAYYELPLESEPLVEDILEHIRY